MKKSILLLVLFATTLTLHAQDTTTFKGRIYNKEYEVYIQMNFYDNNITVPGQDIYGELPGYFGADKDSRKWLFTDATIVNATKAVLQITNDYGSEDLIATLIYNKDGSYTLRQDEGSDIKIAVNRKWVKIPETLIFVKTAPKGK